MSFIGNYEHFEGGHGVLFVSVSAVPKQRLSDRDWAYLVGAVAQVVAE